MHTPTYGDYDISEVRGIDNLMSKIQEINREINHEKRVKIVSDLLLNGHEGVSGYLSFGNTKVSRNTAIFNMNSATDCPNADTTKDNQSDVGMCQVPWEKCYAHKSENIYNDTLNKRRLQEYLWNNIDAVTFSDAILDVKNRMTSSFDFLRISESGDFRHTGDIVKWNTIAKRLKGEIRVYTYSASHKLDWSEAEHFVVNQSNDLADYGDRTFSAVPKVEDVPEDNILCSFDKADKNGIKGDNRPKCGECTTCMMFGDEQPRDVNITIH